MTQAATARPQHCLLCHASLRSPCHYSQVWLAYPTAGTSQTLGIQRLDERLERVLSLALCEVGKVEADVDVCALCVDKLRVIDLLLAGISSFYQASHSADKTQRYDGSSSCTKRGPRTQAYRRDVGTQVLEADLCIDSLQKPRRRSKRSLVTKPRRNIYHKKTVGSPTLDSDTTAVKEELVVESPISDPVDTSPPDNRDVSDSEQETEDTTNKLDVTPQKNHTECTPNVVEPQKAMGTVTETVKSDKKLNVKRSEGRVSPRVAVKCFMCDKCNVSFTKRDKLKRHLRTHSGEKPFECVTCRKRFASKYQMQRHHTQVHTGERRHRCTVCQHGFTELRPLQIHMRKHTGERPYRCTTCNKTFSQGYSLKLHLLTHSGQLPYKCTWCRAEFSRGDSLMIHTRRHTGEKPYPCGTCDMRFADPQNLKKHVRTHAAARQKMYQCTVCTATFFHAYSLKEHAWKHTGQRPYLCSVCGVSFTHLSSLNHHVKSHSGNKPHRCPHCHATFRDPRVLKVHVRKHTGERPFLCVTCGRGFAHHGQLNRHKLTHTGERPHHCLKCSKKFARKDKLQRHSQVVHGTCPDTPAVSVPVKAQVEAAPTVNIQRPHGCSMCDKRYVRKDKLKAHMAKVHQKQPTGPVLSTGGSGKGGLSVLVSQTPVVLSSATSVSQTGTSQVLSSHTGVQNIPQTTQNLHQLNSHGFHTVPSLTTIQNTIPKVTPASGHCVAAWSQHGVTPVTVSQHNVTPVTVSQHGVTPFTVSQHNVTPLTVSQHGVTPLTVSQHNVTPVTVSQHGVTPLTVSQHGVTPLTVSQHGVTPLTVSQHGVTPLTVSQHGVTPLTVSQHGVTPLTVSQHGVTPLTVSQHGVTPLTVSHHGVTPLRVSRNNIRPFTMAQHNVTPLTVAQNNLTLLTVSQSHIAPSYMTPLIMSQPGAAPHQAPTTLPHVGTPYTAVSHNTSHPLNVAVIHPTYNIHPPTN